MQKTKYILVGVVVGVVTLGAFAAGAAYFTDRRVKIRDFLTVGTNVPVSSDAKVTVETGLAANKGIVVVGMTSQSDNLQEWQNVSNTVLAKVASDGDLTAVDGTFTGTLSPDGTLDADSDANFAQRVVFTQGASMTAHTSDQCANTGEYPAGTMFYDSVRDRLCYCNGSNADKTAGSDGSSDCYP